MSATTSPRADPPDPRRVPWYSLRTSDGASTPPAYASDPKYKKYTQQVEKCLNSFDNVQEWADFSSFLKQLLKTFQTYMQFKEIPRKLVVSKRLSQCLNPALPNGVHQRALDVYSHIFAVLGSEGLQRDLVLWSSGLFPFFEYASTAVKPTVLNLFDMHYFPLQAGLRPVMKSFILALLPGLEEETGEYFEKVLGLLDRLAGTISQSFFFQNIWLVMLTTPKARGPCLSYLSRRLPSFKPEEDITHIVGSDLGLMIRGFSAALEDDDLLVRRGALDMLLQSLRIDSMAVTQSQADDRAILMRAATSVVLRRDLALNRRLFSWLLGPGENSQAQVEFYKQNALELLRFTLRDEMLNPSAEYSHSRPFKIFVSLLDKWEIGLPLTEVLVYDAFKAIRKVLGSEVDAGDEMSTTATTLYEAIEPQALWSKLLTVIVADFLSAGVGSEGCTMVQYMLTHFHTHDEEIETIHLPVILGAISSLVKSVHAPNSMTLDALRLELEIVQRIPHAALKARPATRNQEAMGEGDPIAFAFAFYGIKAPPNVPVDSTRSAIPFVTVFEDMIDLSSNVAKALTNDDSDADTFHARRDILELTLMLLDALASRLDFETDTSFSVTWDPAGWESDMLRYLESKAVAFGIVDRFIATAIKLHQTPRLHPRLALEQPTRVSAIIHVLLRYLRPHYAGYHARAVSLVWQLETVGQQRLVESVIAQTLSVQSQDAFKEASEAFAVLWRLTEDNLLPGVHLKVPLVIILDTLKSDDPSVRRIGETWMRCSLKSYLRVLDPLLFELLNPTIRRTPSITDLNGKQLQGFAYERSFDQRYSNHLLEALLSVVKFGGQGFSKVARSTPISRSLYGDLQKRLQTTSIGFPDATYMDILIQLLLLHLQSEPKPTLAQSMHHFQTISQSLSVDLLQAIIARSDIDPVALQTVESTVVQKLYFCIHTGRLDLQNKLLHLLHSIISVSSTGTDTRPLPGVHTADGISLSDAQPILRTASHAVHPLLVQTLIDGLSTPSNHALMQHWLDFIMTTIPQFQETLRVVVVPLTESLCKQLRLALAEVLKVSAQGLKNDDIVASATDADFMSLLTGLERLSLLSLSHVSDNQQATEDSMFPDKNTAESSGLLGYVSNVFGSDGASNGLDDPSNGKFSDYRCLYSAVRVLYSMWCSLVVHDDGRWSSQRESLTLIFTRARQRCKRVLEHLFRAYSTEVLEAVVDCWQEDPSAGDSLAAYELVDVLTSSAQNAVHMLCESIYCRTPGLSERTRKPIVFPNLKDMTIFDFLEQYLRRLEGPVALQVWSRYLQLAKDISTPLRDFRLQAFAALKCFTVLADKVCQSTAFDDRKMRKDLQDTYGKLLDICSLAGRSTDQGTWIRRVRGDALTANGRDSPTARVADAKVDEKMNASFVSLPEAVKASQESDVVEQVNTYFATSVLPSLRRFLLDADKVLAACNQIVYNIITPSTKGKGRPLDLDKDVMVIVREMSKIGSALKAWRTIVSEAFNDSRCFNSSADAGESWMPIIKALFDSDKTALPELLGKITTAASANIFTNREYEMLLRSLNMRRLAYVILSAEKNHFLTQLPSIQEKLVDTLRNVSAPVVQSEVYLCVRVLLCRLSPHNLASFWPVLLTEIYRILEQALASPPVDGSEDLGLILSACKLLDLLLVLQTEEFQIHQWIFITDTVDAVYRPDDWYPAALLDRLSEVIGAIPAGETTASLPPVAHLATPSTDGRMGRQPILQSLRQIDSIRELVPFFSTASIASYESIYHSPGIVDWTLVERNLLEDLFDGR